MRGRATAVSRTGVKLAAAVAITGGVWLLARELRRHSGGGPDASAREDRHGILPAPVRARRRVDRTRRRRVGLDWDDIDEASAQSFPASDPPGYLPLSL